MLLLRISVLLGLSTASLFAAPVKVHSIETELVSEFDAIQPAKPFTAAIRFKIDPTWHIYWLNPGAFGQTTRMDWELPTGFKVSPLQFPTPYQFLTGGFAGYGYEDETMLLATITPPADLKPGAEITLKGKVFWQACDPKSCVPNDAEISLTLPVSDKPGEPTTHGGEIGKYREQLPKLVDWSISATHDAEAKTVTISVEHGGQIRSEMLVFLYPAVEKTVDPTKLPQIEFSPENYSVTMAQNLFLRGDLPEVMSALIYSERGFANPDLGKAVFVTNDPNPAESVPVAPSQSAEADSDVESNGKSNEGWGYWLQRPSIVATLIGLMLLIALNLFGVFEIGMGMTGAGGSLTQKSGLAGSFFSGALATVLATPCTAPFMGLAITYGLKSPPPITLIVFTVLGLGMAAPYLILSRSPALMQKLPKPGAWMETFKQAMAFPMLAVVIALVWVIAHQITDNGLLSVLTGMLLISLGAWWYGRFGMPNKPEKTRRIAWAAAAVLALLAAFVGLRGASQALPGSNRDVEAEIAALQKEGKGVFVDFTAAWCATCQANKAVMHSEKIKNAFEEKSVAFLEVDWTQRDPAILSVIQKYGREGVPLYLLFSADTNEPPQVLANLLTTTHVLAALEGNITQSSVDPNFFTAIIFAFLGGLILNLMPCVFPVISLKIMGFVSQAGENKRQIWHHGLAFAGGALAFFWILAIFLIAARSAVG